MIWTGRPCRTWCGERDVEVLSADGMHLGRETGQGCRHVQGCASRHRTTCCLAACTWEGLEHVTFIVRTQHSAIRRREASTIGPGPGRQRACRAGF